MRANPEVLSKPEAENRARVGRDNAVRIESNTAIWSSIGAAVAGFLTAAAAALRLRKSTPAKGPGEAEPCIEHRARLTRVESAMIRLEEHQFTNVDREGLAKIGAGVASLQVSVSEHLFPLTREMGERLARLETPAPKREGDEKNG